MSLQHGHGILHTTGNCRRTYVPDAVLDIYDIYDEDLLFLFVGIEYMSTSLCLNLAMLESDASFVLPFTTRNGDNDTKIKMKTRIQSPLWAPK